MNKKLRQDNKYFLNGTIDNFSIVTYLKCLHCPIKIAVGLVVSDVCQKK